MFKNSAFFWISSLQPTFPKNSRTAAHGETYLLCWFHHGTQSHGTLPQLRKPAEKPLPLITAAIYWFSRFFFPQKKHTQHTQRTGKNLCGFFNGLIFVLFSNFFFCVFFVKCGRCHFGEVFSGGSYRGQRPTNDASSFWLSTHATTPGLRRPNGCQKMGYCLGGLGGLGLELG